VELVIQLESALKTGTFGTILLKYPYETIYRFIFSLKFRNWEAEMLRGADRFKQQ
jgi:hypothetical protein